MLCPHLFIVMVHVMSAGPDLVIDLHRIEGQSRYLAACVPDSRAVDCEAQVLTYNQLVSLCTLYLTDGTHRSADQAPHCVSGEAALYGSHQQKGLAAPRLPDDWKAPMHTTEAPVKIGVIGAGWRADYYLRIAQYVPTSFSVGAVLVRTEHSADRISSTSGQFATTDFKSFLARGPFDYVVLAVPADAASEFMIRLVAANIPVLTETPPARDLADLNAQFRSIGAASIQVAEQYQFQAHHAARLAVARAGLLGDVHTAYVSAAHGYHGVALMRQALLAGFRGVSISGRTILDRVASPRGRDDWLPTIVESEAERDFAWLDFDGGSLGIYDFMGDQYVSPIRARTLKLSGPQGELTNDIGAHVTEPGVARTINLRREATGVDGDLEGFFLRRIADGPIVYWENEYPGARLNDDELAVARVMGLMTKYVRTGTPFYSLADGSHDHYLGLLIGQAVKTGTTLRSEPQAWSNATSVFE